MADPKRNAAIWYASDGYDPTRKGLNGRRVAGESFLKGFFQNADVDEFQAIVGGIQSDQEFHEIAAKYAKDRPVRAMHKYYPKQTLDASTVHYPSPDTSSEAWRRMSLGQTAFSITGITHTTSTDRAMKGMYDLRAAPTEPWDGLICTSNAVFDQVKYQFDLFDSYAQKRFGSAKPTRMSQTMIPLGVNTKDFETTQADRSALREQIGAGKDDVVFLVLSRLSAHEKFDPLPFYRALGLAQKRSNAKVHLILCGYFADKLCEDVFRNGAQKLMPQVMLHVLDGKDRNVRMQSYAAADVFAFPIDNLQETFGLAPVEAMAAGLPVIASDWDGLRDTVSDDVGFRIPTTMPSQNNTSRDSLSFQLGVNSYAQHLLISASMTVIDVPAMVRAMVQLIESPELREKMGRAARHRARTKFDWSVIIPRMQDYWEHLTDIRLHAQAQDRSPYQGMDVPVSPPTGRLFASYPTTQGVLWNIPLSPTPGVTDGSVRAIVKLRGFERLRRFVEPTNRMSVILAVFLAQDAPRTPAQIAQITGFSRYQVSRTCHFLLKYDLLRIADKGH